MKEKIFSALSCLILIFFVSQAVAQTADTGAGLFNRDAQPIDINSIPVLSNLVKNGAKLYYLGERSGLHGWFIMKDGQVQMIYVTGDKKTAIIGGMFTSDGENVTGPQIQALANVNKEVNELITYAGRQQEEIAKAGVEGGFAAIPGGTQTDSSGKAGKGIIPAVSLSPGERLMQDLRAAAGVYLGKNERAELLVVIDPKNPRCLATWREMRKSVKEGLVQVKLIPAAVSGSDGARIGALFLKAENPLENWNKYVDGDSSAFAGQPDELSVRAVEANSEMLKRWNIGATPYIVYRAKDGRVKIVQGEPQRMASILLDLPQ